MKCILSTLFSSASDVSSGSGSVKLTGDSRADADILAFIKARQNLLQQRGGFNLYTARKRMAAVHFTTILCESNTVNRHMGSHIFREIRLCNNNIVYSIQEIHQPRKELSKEVFKTLLEPFRTFLCVFVSVFSVFVR